MLTFASFTDDYEEIHHESNTLNIAFAVFTGFDFHVIVADMTTDQHQSRAYGVRKLLFLLQDKNSKLKVVANM